jgi:hypothetical protein
VFCRLGEVLPQRVERPYATFETPDHSRSFEFAEMMTDGRLSKVECRSEVAYTDRPRCGLQHVHHLDPGRIGKSLVDLGQIVSYAIGKWRRQLDAAPSDPIRRFCNRFRHAVSVLDPLTTVDAFAYGTSIDNLRSKGSEAHVSCPVGAQRQ